MFIVFLTGLFQKRCTGPTLGVFKTWFYLIHGQKDLEYFRLWDSPRSTERFPTRALLYSATRAFSGSRAINLDLNAPKYRAHPVTTNTAGGAAPCSWSGSWERGPKLITNPGSRPEAPRGIRVYELPLFIRGRLMRAVFFVFFEG